MEGGSGKGVSKGGILDALLVGAAPRGGEVRRVGGDGASGQERKAGGEGRAGEGKKKAMSLKERLLMLRWVSAASREPASRTP